MFKRHQRSILCSNSALGEQRRSQITKRDATKPDSPSLIQGYGAVFYNAADPGTEYWLWNDVVERVMPGAFDNVLANTPDIRGLFNHDVNFVLGRTLAGTCRVSVDAIGLKYECDESPDDPTWLGVAQKISRGDVSGSSYSFIPKTITWEETRVNDSTVYIRWIKEVEVVFDVGPVTFPAFTAATSSRSDDPERAQLQAERLALMAASDGDDIAVRMRLVETSLFV